MSDLSKLTEGLDKAITNVELRKAELSKAEAVHSKASTDYDTAKIEAKNYRSELDKLLNSLLGVENPSRIRAAS